MYFRMQKAAPDFQNYLEEETPETTSRNQITFSAGQ